MTVVTGLPCSSVNIDVKEKRTPRDADSVVDRNTKDHSISSEELTRED